LRPDLDNFLFAEIGEEKDGIQLSMISVLTRLGLDPWDEAGRLSALSRPEAGQQLGRLIAELPDACRPLAEAREIAARLVEQLPRNDSNRQQPAQIRFRWPTVPGRSRWLMFCLVAAAAALVSLILHSGFPFGIGSP
jgi:hypothetical protein